MMKSISWSAIPPHEFLIAHLANVGVLHRRIHEIVKGKQAVTADTALRLER